MTTFRELEAFVAVVEMGSFERAAGSLHTSQSAISRLIKELEDGLPCPLLSRDRRATLLTKEGQELLDLARAILRQRDVVLERFTGAGVAPRYLRLGATELVATTWLPGFVSRLRERHADLRIELTVGLTPDMYALLRERRLDLAFVGEISQFAHVSRVLLGAAQFAWYCSPQLRFAQGISLAEFEKQTLLILGSSRGSGLRIARWFLGSDVKPTNVIHCDSWAAMAGIAAAGLGIACLPEAIAQEPVSHGALALVPLPAASPRMDYSALFRPDAPSEFYRDAVQLAKSCCDFRRPFQVSPAAQQEATPFASRAPGPEGC